MGAGGRPYTVDPETRGAESSGVLAAVSGDDRRFAGFGDARFGADFNPAADRCAWSEAAPKTYAWRPPHAASSRAAA